MKSRLAFAFAPAARQVGVPGCRPTIGMGAHVDPSFLGNEDVFEEGDPVRIGVAINAKNGGAASAKPLIAEGRFHQGGGAKGGVVVSVPIRPAVEGVEVGRLVINDDEGCLLTLSVFQAFMNSGWRILCLSHIMPTGQAMAEPPGEAPCSLTEADMDIVLPLYEIGGCNLHGRGRGIESRTGRRFHRSA